MHDQILWVFHKSGMEDLLLYIASSSDEAQYCLHVLEIISLMFREQVSNQGGGRRSKNVGIPARNSDIDLFVFLLGSKVFSVGQFSTIQRGT